MTQAVLTVWTVTATTVIARIMPVAHAFLFRSGCATHAVSLSAAIACATLGTHALSVSSLSGGAAVFLFVRKHNVSSVEYDVLPGQ